MKRCELDYGINNLTYNIEKASNDEDKRYRILDDYLDYLYSLDDVTFTGIVKDEPLPESTVHIVEYAYIAAIIESLSNKRALTPPRWVYKSRFYLSTHHFPSNLPVSIERILFCTSPFEFRKRGIYVSANALTRG